MSYEKIKPVEYTEAELRELWRCEYCRKVIHTHDGIRVRFYEDQFDHAFYESTNRKKANKDALSYARLEKMLWIKDVLADASARKQNPITPTKECLLSKGIMLWLLG